jgi:hypothetical protein
MAELFVWPNFFGSRTFLVAELFGGRTLFVWPNLIINTSLEEWGTLKIVQAMLEERDLRLPS